MRRVLGSLTVLAIGGCSITGFGTAAVQQQSGSLSVVSPEPGQTITTLDIPVRIAVRDFVLQSRDIGKPAKAGQGHIHVMIDKPDMEHMAEIFDTERFTIPGEGLSPGKHTLYVEFAGDDHRALSKPVEIEIDYQPIKGLPLPQAVTLGQPGVRIVSPTEGATVPRKFELKVETTNFNSSCVLEGKSNVQGYGHFHVFVNQEGITDRPSALGSDPMAMVGMVGMPCATTIPVDVSTWKAGPAKISVLLAKNDHMHLDIPPAVVNVTVE